MDHVTQRPAAKKAKLHFGKLHRTIGNKFLLAVSKSANLPVNIGTNVLDLFEGADFAVIKYKSLAAAAVIVGMEFVALNIFLLLEDEFTVRIDGNIF